MCVLSADEWFTLLLFPLLLSHHTLLERISRNVFFSLIKSPRQPEASLLYHNVSREVGGGILIIAY